MVVRRSSMVRPFGSGSFQGRQRKAPVAQLDRALPSEGKGHTFESCRVRHRFNVSAPET